MNLASRIASRDGDFATAEVRATESLGTSRSRGPAFAALQVGALISRGEARLGQNRADDARKDFELALEINSASRGPRQEVDNPQLEARCVLNLALCYARDEKKGRAVSLFNRWLEVAPRVENQDVLDFAADVHAEVYKPGQDFVIFGGEKNLNFKERKRLLQRYLYDRAVENSNGRKQAVADSLGITRQALHIWEQEMTRDNS